MSLPEVVRMAEDSSSVYTSQKQTTLESVRVLVEREGKTSDGINGQTHPNDLTLRRVSGNVYCGLLCVHDILSCANNGT